MVVANKSPSLGENFGESKPLSLLETNCESLPETNSSHLKMDGWNTSFLFGWPIFQVLLLLVLGRDIYQGFRKYLRFSNPSVGRKFQGPSI